MCGHQMPAAPLRGMVFHFTQCNGSRCGNAFLLWQFWVLGTILLSQVVYVCVPTCDKGGGAILEKKACMGLRAAC